ncbi:P-loop NTPase family protein [Neolewinella persica]|uniref:hypothetical protein n=1 Tax=Neolewinella persica TaxID=70998 RepID=UPI00037E24AF|nr:hypothetical protein [Neolewinella persica]
MSTLIEQFKFQLLSDHFEADPHLEVRNLPIREIHLLHGEAADDDIVVVEYENSPALSFYNTRGRLIDVDHYLPDHYPELDRESTDSVMKNLRGSSTLEMNNPDKFREIIDEVYEAGGKSLSAGLRKKFGLETTKADERRFKAQYNFRGNSEDFKSIIVGEFQHFKDFLNGYLGTKLQGSNGYVHLTPIGNIIITTLNKRSGMAVLIETRDTEGILLPTSRWLITRTNNPKQLEQALVFRSKDIQDFFTADGYETTFNTDRYQLTHSDGLLEIDSLLDNTNNLLKVDLYQNCYHLLAGDPNLIVALISSNEVTIINTHRSVVPGKWSQTIKLTKSANLVRADENLATLFAQGSDGIITVYDITQPEVAEIAELGKFAPGFQLDAMGSVVGRESMKKTLVKVRTNAPDLELPEDEANFATAFKNLSQFFKGESLFTKTNYARPIADALPEKADQLPSAVEVARYDFETNIEHLLADAGQDYERLLDVREKIAIARTNIGEELTQVAEREGILLVGRRLQSTINNIVRPVERRVRGLVETTRAQQLIEKARGYRAAMDSIEDPAAYRDIINGIRAASDELDGMTTGEGVAEVITEFRIIQREMNAAFSEQIAKDGNSLQEFITREIEQIELAITNTHEFRQLENLLATHPASVELMSLLKQPFVLQSIASEQRLSPAGIQNRLHKAVNLRRSILKQEQDRKNAEVNAAKLQLAQMVQESIDFFVGNHSGSFSDLELAKTAAYQDILKDTGRIETQFNDVRLARELRQRLERRILERNREDMERMVAFEGKYAFIQNDPDLFVDLESSLQTFPKWDLEVIEKKGQPDIYAATFIRNTDKEVYLPTTTDNLRSGRAFEISGSQQQDFFAAYDYYVAQENSYELCNALWEMANGLKQAADFPQFKPELLKELLPEGEASKKGLRCVLEKKYREDLERKRSRNVPVITPEFIDETPYFQEKLREFIIKAKLQLTTGAGIILLSGPPSTGKSAFLKFVAAVMNREYFEHASDKWQTKNSLVTAIKFGENGPYTTPAGFTKAITTPNSLINIEEIKEWPEALRKSLNPFFAGSDVFLAPDGTAYKIGDNILLCAAANLGAIYRQDDEPFTADFWSRIEVVEYDYAPHAIERTYYDDLHAPRKNNLLTMRDLARNYFGYRELSEDPKTRARELARKFLDFLLLPKADEKVKRDNLRHQIDAFFRGEASPETIFGPEEAAKVALRRLRDFQGYSPANFFDLYDHFVNNQPLRGARLAKLQTTDVQQYEHLRVMVLALHALEGCLRHLREQFYSSAGQTEIEGTNREFIGAVYLLGLVG